MKSRFLPQEKIFNLRQVIINDLKLSQLSYSLPKNLIANKPASPRDHSRLMVVDRQTRLQAPEALATGGQTGTIRHKLFYELFDILSKGDVLVLNNTKVYPARAIGKRESGGKVEVLFLKNVYDNVWEILGKNIPWIGENIIFGKFYAKVVKKGLGTARIEVFTRGKNLLDILSFEGKVPIPPYISTELSERELRRKYQTVYSDKTGSVAAPTAGLHFTKRLLRELKKKRVVIQYVTLHVGLGTFAPIKEDDVTKHKMHSEYYSVSSKSLQAIKKAKREKRRIIAVGTTTARVLETIANVGVLSGYTNIFIYPPYKFRFVDALVTNFHLPHSTLLAMVSAFVSFPNLPAQAGAENKFIDFKSSLVGRAYKEAIKNKYRFYSFGDAMLIM